MKHPKVSVCVNTYNRAGYIGEAIRSVLQQTLQDFELIVLDACSPDNTEEVVKGFHDSRIVYVRTENRIGPTEGWIRSVSMARGKYFGILNDDDIYLPRMLEVECDVLDRNPSVGLVHSAFFVFDDRGRALKVAHPASGSYIHDGLDEFKRHITENNYICAQTALVRKECYESCGGFDPRLVQAADWDLWLRMELRGYQVAFADEPLAGSRIHSGSITTRSIESGAVLNEMLSMLSKILEGKDFQEAFSPPEATSVKQGIQRNVVRHLCYFSYRCLRGGNLKGAFRYFQLLLPRSHLQLKPPSLTVLGEILSSGASYFLASIRERFRDRNLPDFPLAGL